MFSSTAFYAGSFDPLTNGHLDVIAGALQMATHVFVGIGVHPDKRSLFDAQERARLIRAAASAELGEAAERLRIVTFAGLAVDAAREQGAGLIVRGIRDGSDLDYEMHMAGMNAAMAPDLRTVFLPASASVRMITGTLVRQVAAMGGNVGPFVPPLVAAALRDKFAANHARTQP